MKILEAMQAANLTQIPEEFFQVDFSALTSIQKGLTMRSIVAYTDQLDEIKNIKNQGVIDMIALCMLSVCDTTGKLNEEKILDDLIGISPLYAKKLLEVYKYECLTGLQSNVQKMLVTHNESVAIKYYGKTDKKALSQSIRKWESVAKIFLKQVLANLEKGEEVKTDEFNTLEAIGHENLIKPAFEMFLKFKPDSTYIFEFFLDRIHNAKDKQVKEECAELITQAKKLIKAKAQA